MRRPRYCAATHADLLGDAVGVDRIRQALPFVHGLLPLAVNVSRKIFDCRRRHVSLCSDGVCTTNLACSWGASQALCPTVSRVTASREVKLCVNLAVEG